MRFVDRPRPAQIYVASICALALLQAAVAAWQPAANAASIGLFVLLVVAATVAHSFPVSTPGQQAYHVSLPFFIAAIILLSPLQLIGLVAIVHVVEGLRVRRSTSVQIFNGAAFALSGLIAQAIYMGLWPVQGQPAADLSQPACLAAGVAAAIGFAILNRVLVSVAIWLGSRIPPRQQQMFDLDGLLTDGVLLLMGIPLAHLLWIAPWAGLVGAAPLWLIHRVLDLPNLRAQSRQDGLTELFTAPYLTETCTREINRGRRFNRPVTLLLLDVDGLGELNAVHGQQTGDAVLRATARTISAALREYDLAARLAGGLFAVLLPEADLAAAQVVAERVRRQTAEQRHEVAGSVEQARVTLSIGAAIVNGQSVTAAQLFDAARTALAHAKTNGGNQIAFEALQAPTVVPLADEPSSTQTGSHAPGLASRGGQAAEHRHSTPLTGWVRAHAHTVGICSLAAIGVSICLVGAIAQLDWPLLAVMVSLSILASFAFYFRSLPLALALAAELNRSPARLAAARLWRLWPQYAALCAGGLLIVYAYARLGLTGALGVAGFGLVVRYLAGRYVDRTLESVRKLRNANESLEHQAFHDPLTNLPNRALFAERLQHAMLRAGNGSVAVLFIDLDNFKAVNDTLGHGAGDLLLISATERLLQCVRREDTIARLGGDEFTVLLEDMHDPSDAARMAERICEALRQPFDIQGRRAFVSSSIGIALDTDRSHGPDDLMREADLAMYRAKSNGKARYEIFDTFVGERAMQRLGLETELRQAIERGEMLLAYQPVVAVDSQDVVALLAVPRWQHPRHGLLEAHEFQRIAEDTGVVVEIGRWLLGQACRDARQWQARRPGLNLHVRISARELDQAEAVQWIERTLAESELRPDLLTLEVSEPSGEATARLNAVSQLGVNLALADVGSGPLALDVLTRLPFRALKLAPSAIGSPDLVRATRGLAAALGLPITAPAGPTVAPVSIDVALSPAVARRAA
jgi:diguanylate cyclase (GGDEF)-like protein